MKNVTQCESLCASANLVLTSVVVVANRTGCVCQVPGVAVEGDTSVSVVGGAIAAMEAEQAARAAQAAQAAQATRNAQQY